MLSKQLNECVTAAALSHSHVGDTKRYQHKHEQQTWLLYCQASMLVLGNVGCTSPPFLYDYLSNSFNNTSHGSNKGNLDTALAHKAK